MTRIKRAKWIIRLSLLTLLLLFFTAIMLLLSNPKETILPNVARELLTQWQKSGSQRGEELVSILGQPTLEKQNIKGKRLSWLFEEESPLKMPLFAIVAEIDHEDHVYGLIIQDTIYQGSELWKYRWERLKQRLRFE